MVSQNRRHLFVTPYVRYGTVSSAAWMLVYLNSSQFCELTFLSCRSGFRNQQMNCENSKGSTFICNKTGDGIVDPCANWLFLRNGLKIIFNNLLMFSPATGFCPVTRSTRAQRLSVLPFRLHTRRPAGKPTSPFMSHSPLKMPKREILGVEIFTLSISEDDLET